MYLLAVRMLKREYTLAARLIPSILSDVPFRDEETWVKNLFGEVSDDPHPDAIALRLRIGLQCAECHELPPFGGGGDERLLTNPSELDGLRRHRYGSDHCRTPLSDLLVFSLTSGACRTWPLAHLDSPLPPGRCSAP